MLGEAIQILLGDKQSKDHNLAVELGLSDSFLHYDKITGLIESYRPTVAADARSYKIGVSLTCAILE